MLSERAVLLAEEHEKNRHQVQAEWDVSPKDMKRPANIKIKSDRFGAVCGGAWLTPPCVGSRPLRPKEVVTVDLDWPVVQALLGRDAVEVTTDPANRPVVFPTDALSKDTNPKRKKVRPEDRQAAWAKVRKLMAERNQEFNSCGGPRQGVVSAMDEDLKAAVQEVEKEEAAKPKKSTPKTAPKLDTRDTTAAVRDR